MVKILGRAMMSFLLALAAILYVSSGPSAFELIVCDFFVP
jgi:hypothetical protein